MECKLRKESLRIVELETTISSLSAVGEEGNLVSLMFRFSPDLSPCSDSAWQQVESLKTENENLRRNLSELEQSKRQLNTDIEQVAERRLKSIFGIKNLADIILYDSWSQN